MLWLYVGFVCLLGYFNSVGIMLLYGAVCCFDCRLAGLLVC